MGLLTGCAQFQHIAKQRNPPPAGAGGAASQHIQRRAHAVRAGVVAIFQEGDAAAGYQVLPHTGRLVTGQRGGRAGRIKPQAGRGGVGSQRVIDGVAADSGNMD